MALRRLALVSVVALGEGEDANGLRGEELAADVGCLACHTESSTHLAPTLHGIWGTETDLADGRTIEVDDVYVRRSITDPAADVVDGYGLAMPPVPLDDAEVDRLVEWVESLG